MIKPILFNTDMVKAILEGRKTVTRRIVKPQLINSICGSFSVGEIEVDPDVITEKRNLDFETLKGTYAWFEHSDYEEFSRYVKLPYAVGDILWVRETWNGITTGNGKTVPLETEYWYRADEPDFNPDNKWHPSLHMPKSAARIFLKVSGARVERLQDITEEDAIKEGVEALHETIGDGKFQDVESIDIPARVFFVDLWDSTIPKEKLDINGWDANPYVFVYEFERCEKPEGFGV